MGTVQKLMAMTLLAALAGTALADLAEIPSGTYKLDKTHGYVNFSYTHLGFSVPTVGFREFDVELQYDAEDPAESDLGVTIQAASVDSRVDDFDAHLRGEDFFNVAEHPEIIFRATGIEINADSSAAITGDLTILGTTKPVVLSATLNKAGMHPLAKVLAMGFNATTRVKRSEWGLGYAVPMVTDDVDINISVELHKSE
ncbi:MAG: YceI family protein [Gammaproteobacteria bacterium]|nr:YceI family protein [Gammaproteobacteria bacterium]